VAEIGEKEAVWIPEADDVLPGTAEKEDRTDQRCPYCGRWFGNRGYNAHTENCDFAESEYYCYNEETERIEYNELAWPIKSETDEYLGRWLREVE